VVNLRIDLGIDDSASRHEPATTVYRRLARAQSLDDVQKLLDELADRYGTPGPAIQNLAQYARTRILADAIGLESLDREGLTVVLKFRQDAKIDPVFLAELIQSRGDLTLLPPAVLRLDLTKPEEAPEGAGRRLRRPLPARNLPGGVSSSWWIARARSEVTPGFTRDEILAELPPDLPSR
jgi:transcription-repair coupling factor (superfamily II helicase)